MDGASTANVQNRALSSYGRLRLAVPWIAYSASGSEKGHSSVRVQDAAARQLRVFGRNSAALGTGTGFDVAGVGRVESTGCVTSGRRWHRRIPCSSHRFGAALSTETPMTKHFRASPSSPRSRRSRRVARCRSAARISRISRSTRAATRTAPSASTASSPARGAFRSCRSASTRSTMGRVKLTVLSRQLAHAGAGRARARQGQGPGRRGASAASAVGLHICARKTSTSSGETWLAHPLKR